MMHNEKLTDGQLNLAHTTVTENSKKKTEK